MNSTNKENEARGESPAAMRSPWRTQLSELFSLQADKADDLTIDESLRAGVVMRGTNLWLLIFAIFVASIGLNVNSTAVIIGAMLISPLMGPIMGVGYGIGIYDFALVRNALANLAVAVFISLCTSVLYFLLSPLTQAQSELLARTTPTIWDVLIALVGGLAGIVAVTRKEKSNVLPGVAIATALMPPLCTAGFGLANGNWAFFGGAFYLFTINCVFIALASALVVHGFHVKEKVFIDAKVAARVKTSVMLVTILTVVPSIFLAYRLVQDEVFKVRANQFVERNIASKRSYVTQVSIDPGSRLIEVTVIGDYLDTQRLAAIEGQLTSAGLPETKLEVRQQDDRQKVDVVSLKTSLLSDLYTKSQQVIEKKDQEILQLQKQVNAQQMTEEQMKSLPAELNALFPQITQIWLSHGIGWQQSTGAQPENVLLINLATTQGITPAERAKLDAWLAARLKGLRLKLVIASVPIATSEPASAPKVQANKKRIP